MIVWKIGLTDTAVVPFLQCSLTMYLNNICIQLCPLPFCWHCGFFPLQQIFADSVFISYETLLYILLTSQVKLKTHGQLNLFSEWCTMLSYFRMINFHTFHWRDVLTPIALLVQSSIWPVFRIPSCQPLKNSSTVTMR